MNKRYRDALLWIARVLDICVQAIRRHVKNATPKRAPKVQP